MKKGLRLRQCCRVARFRLVRTPALMKKGLRPGCLSVAGLVIASPNARPDEEGIKTQSVFAAVVDVDQVRTPALMKKGLRHTIDAILYRW